MRLVWSIRGFKVDLEKGVAVAKTQEMVIMELAKIKHDDSCPENCHCKINDKVIERSRNEQEAV